jgi:hypothetical protein
LGNELKADINVVNELIQVIPDKWPVGLIEAKLIFDNAPDFSSKLIKH